MSGEVDKLLPAVYESQRDNVFDGSNTCAVTTLSMLLQSQHMGATEAREAKHIEDDILKDLRAAYPKTHEALRKDFIFLAGYAKLKYGCALKYAAYNKNEWIAKILETPAPFMTSTSDALTPYGHICLARGMKTDGEVLLYFNDPYGRYPYKTKASGEGVLYPASQFPLGDPDGTQRKYHTLSYP